MGRHHIHHIGVRVLYFFHTDSALIPGNRNHLLCEQTENPKCPGIRMFFESNPNIFPQNIPEEKHQIIVSGSHNNLIRLTVYAAGCMQISCNRCPQFFIALSLSRQKQFLFVLTQNVFCDFSPGSERKFTHSKTIRGKIHFTALPVLFFCTLVYIFLFVPKLRRKLVKFLQPADKISLIGNRFNVSF